MTIRNLNSVAYHEVMELDFDTDGEGGELRGRQRDWATLTCFQTDNI